MPNQSSRPRISFRRQLRKIKRRSRKNPATENEEGGFEAPYCITSSPQTLSPFRSLSNFSVHLAGLVINRDAGTGFFAFFLGSGVGLQERRSFTDGKQFEVNSRLCFLDPAHPRCAPEESAELFGR